MKVGTGIFTWHASERRTDRYGYFFLHPSNYEETAYVLSDVNADALAEMECRKVRIVCRVLESRTSGHIGDLFHGIFPTKPDVGEVVDLGVGVLDLVPPTERIGTQIGLIPDDGREHFWIDPNKLYHLHDQTVEVEIEAA